MKKNIARLKERVCRSIDAHRDEICALGEDIRVHPELGFKEFRTAGIVSDFFGKLGVGHETGLAVTGVKGVLEGRKKRATVACLGEMDSVLVSEHPDADPVTGAAHACGHHAQVANLLALACGLVESGVMSELDGNVALMAVPAEEYVEVGWRMEQKVAGKIEFLGGKPELVRLGAFDDVQAVMMTHQSVRREGGDLGVAGANNGCLVKMIRYLGRAAHAGGAPHDGINALKAAMTGLQAIDANRETFRDTDHIRVHPIITRGGELVNVVPAEVTMETYVRGASIKAIRDAARKVDRSLKAGALALGATVEIQTIPGYLPRLLHEPLAAVYLENAALLLGGEGNVWKPSGHGGGSTDMGDLSHLMPAIEASAAGCQGRGHGPDYLVRDPEKAYILPAKAMAMTVVDLLADGAKKTRRILDSCPPEMDRETYLAFMRRLCRKTTWPARGARKKGENR